MSGDDAITAAIEIPLDNLAGTIMVPGHDMPMAQKPGADDLSRQESSRPDRLVRRQPGDVTSFALTV